MKTATTKPAAATTATTTAPETVDMPLRTKHVAAQFKMKPVQLRRILRSMPAYADGVHTNYRWAEKDPRLAEIQKAIAKAAEDKAIRAKAAQDALAKRASDAAKEAKATKAA